MEKLDFKDMKRGWFVGDFLPTAFPSKECEVGWKRYQKGDEEPTHVHKIATEITVIIKGTVSMNGQEFSEGDIVVVSPNEPVKFIALTDAENVVVKIPSVKGDKYAL